jgi:nitroimidazol reductase NimA-like FMN-containing flavoprotein (pyridoxamine 5'-phosphate oxidase superfamily)
MTDRGPGNHTRVRRLPKKARYDAATVDAIIDAAPFCTLAATIDGLAMAIPTLHSRQGDLIYLHGSQSNAALRSWLAAGRGSLSVTLYDGLRLARSGFESSIAYRSVTVVGRVREVEGEERRAALNGFVDAVLPGRGREVRPLREQEERLTLVVALSIEEASAKLSEGPTSDDVDDQQLEIWSGTVPARLVYDAPIPDTNGAMSDGHLDLPDSVRRLFPS